MDESMIWWPIDKCLSSGDASSISNFWNNFYVPQEHPNHAYSPDNLPNISRVIFNNPATIVYWTDGTKTVVKCQPGDTFSAETGLMAAMLKRFMGNDNSYNKVINRCLDTFAPKPAPTEVAENHNV